MPVRRHSPNRVRVNVPSPRTMSRDAMQALRKRQEEAVTKANEIEHQRQVAEENHVPAITSRQGLINAGLIKA